MNCQNCQKKLPNAVRRGRRPRYCSGRCRVAAHRARNKPLLGSVMTDNSDLIAAAIKLHLRMASPLFADVTYGPGVFWRRANGVRLIASDIRPLPGIAVQADFQALPYRDAAFDGLVLDPPYVHHPATHHTTERYNSGTTDGMDHDGILNLYRAGIAEAARVLKPDGILLIKCKDEVESGQQRWSAYRIARGCRRIRICRCRFAAAGTEATEG